MMGMFGYGAHNEEGQAILPVHTIRPVHTAPFCTKTDKKISVFVKLFTLLRTKRTKTEIFENALQSGYSQKRRF